jgi:hypothetical protein
MAYFEKGGSFLANGLTFMLIYVWSRRNPTARMNMMGIFNFDAPYLPFVLLGFPLILGGGLPWGDIPGLIAGHIYYFFEDIYPRMPGSNGVKYLATPTIFRALFEGMQRDRADATLPPTYTATIPPPGPQDAQNDAPPVQEHEQEQNAAWEDIAADMEKINQEDGNPGGYDWTPNSNLKQRPNAATANQ